VSAQYPPAPIKELEQKFKILLSQPQEQRDFDAWRADIREHASLIGILFIDIDHFKGLNSRHTETKVDETILPEAQKLLKQLTNYRGGAYRHGGEEFVVMLPNYDREEIMAFAEKVRAAFETQKFQVDGTDEAVTVSIGVAIWPYHGENLSDVLAVANIAEHQAKIEGRNTVRIGT
jgi:diguanylate cyclase (GGDEF)-like protein